MHLCCMHKAFALQLLKQKTFRRKTYRYLRSNFGRSVPQLPLENARNKLRALYTALPHSTSAQSDSISHSRGNNIQGEDHRKERPRHNDRTRRGPADELIMRLPLTPSCPIPRKASTPLRIQQDNLNSFDFSQRRGCRI